MDALNIKQWWKVIDPVVEKYNGTKHETTSTTPNEAARIAAYTEEGRTEAQEIRETTESTAHFNRKYPSLSVGDRVKVIRKPGKYSEFKANFNSWSQDAFTVEQITIDDGSTLYKLSDRVRPLMRHELLKVEDVQKTPRRRVMQKSEPEKFIGNAKPSSVGG